MDKTLCAREWMYTSSCTGNSKLTMDDVAPMFVKVDPHFLVLSSLYDLNLP